MNNATNKAVTITVRYTQGTYVARAKGHKPTASCVYDAGIAAQALARKIGIEPAQLVMTKGDRDWLEFSVIAEKTGDGR